jgi:tRNA pseudouridine38-40 synthase
MRVKAIIQYDGTDYFGFQKQSQTAQTVAGELERTLRSLHIDVTIVGSGRTDRGVHATGQVIHFDLPSYWQDLERLQTILNRKLSSIFIKQLICVNSQFHARFSAKKRSYRYLFKTTQPSVFEQDYIAYYPPFDGEILKEALSLFQGEHDFCYFHKTGSPTHTTIREVYQARYRPLSRGYHMILFQANGFLRSQVRMMVESAMLSARGELTLASLQEQLQGKKQHTSRLAPASGLYLSKILY